MNKHNQLTLQDPLSVLPTEVFCHLLSSLPPASIAHASATARDWRQAILSDSTLFDEIDLTRLNTLDTETCKAIIHHLKSLISKARSKVIKCSFDLTPFRGWSIDGIRRIAIDCSGLLQPFQAALQPLHASLKEISLEIKKPKNYHGADSLRLILPLLEHFHADFSVLKTIFISTFLDLEIKAGGEGLGEKSFVMITSEEARNNRCGEEVELESESADHILGILGEVNGLKKNAGFTEFYSRAVIDYNHIGAMKDATIETWASILKQLEGSKRSLQKLNLRVLGNVSDNQSWDLAMNCIQVEHLCLDLQVVNELQLAADSPPFANLKELNLGGQSGFEQCQIPWVPFIQKIGTNLKILRLKGDIGGLLLSWDLLASLFVNVREALEILYLNWDSTGATGTDEKEPVTHQIEDFLNFPNLKELELDRIDGDEVGFFLSSPLITPKLSNFTFYQYFKGGNPQIFAFLIKTITSNAETLVRIDITLHDDDEDEARVIQLPQAIPFSLPKLETMSISAPPEFVEWLSRLHYPQFTQGRWGRS